MTTGSAQAACAHADDPVAYVHPRDAAAAIECVVAEQRAAAGLPAWTAERRLGLAAFRHARDMIRRGYFGHRSPEGTNVMRRVKRTGYYRSCMPCAIGENLHWGRAGRTTPTRIVRAWMRSPGHREVLLSSRFQQVGVGFGRGAAGTRLRSVVTTTLVAGG